MKIIKNRKHNVNADRATRARQFGIKAARIGKTKQVSVLQGNYGYGWDDLCEYDGTSNRECREDLKLYRENEPGVPFRVIYRRVPNPDYVETPVEQSTSTKRKYTIEASKSAKRNILWQVMRTDISTRITHVLSVNSLLRVSFMRLRMSILSRFQMVLGEKYMTLLMI